MTPTTAPMLVHSLICHRDVGMAVTCLTTLYRCADRAIDLRLHDDGSITPDDAAQLQAAFPTARLISREESDQLAAEGLRSLPKCREFRGVTVMGLKLFDPLLMGRDPFLLLDTDVLFFNPFENLFAPVPQGYALIYMEDFVYSYSVTPQETLAHRELRPVRLLNAGMLFVYAGQIDLEYIEYLLAKHPHLVQKGGVTEQTAWGILGMRHGARKWNRRQVSIVTDDFQPGADQVAAHFVSPTRHRLAAFAAGTGTGLSGRRVRVETEAATPYSSIRTLGDFLGNRIHNRLYRLRQTVRAAKAT